MSGNIPPAWLGGTGSAPNSGISSSIPPNTSSSSSSSFGMKPKFAPKVPIKKEKEPLIANPGSDAPKETTVKKEKTFTKSRDFSQKPKNINNNLNGGGGRKWVMPTGVAFFSGGVGTNDQATPSRAPVNPISNRPTAVKPTTQPNADGSLRIARPNEQIEEVQMTTKDILATHVRQNASKDSDSDGEGPDGGQLSLEEALNITDEVWPPEQYDPTAPLSLPIGPKSKAMRAALAAETILADPNDAAALEKEESSSLFLMQMPSDLRFDKLRPSTSSRSNTGKATKIGKMQLLASGAVRLVTTDGKIYEVNSGLATSFVQILSSVDVPSAPATVSSNDSHVKSEHKKGASAAVPDANVEEQTGSIYLMGSITKKLVLSPQFDIGVRRVRAYSTATSDPKLSAPMQFLQQSMQEEDAIEMMDDDEVMLVE